MKKFLHIRAIKILLLVIFVFSLQTFLVASQAASAPKEPFEVKVVFDKAIYKKGDTVNVSLLISKVQQDAPASLRIYIALKDSAGKTIAYRNRYISSLAGSSASVSASLNTANLKISGNVYTLEVSLFSAGRLLQTKKSVVVLTENPPSLQVAYLVKLQMPFRLTGEDVLSDEKPVEYLINNQAVLNNLSYLSSQKIPLIIVISSSTLVQLNQLSDGFRLESKESKKEFDSNSPQVQIIKRFSEVIKKAISDGNTNVALFPFGDVSPVTLYDHELFSETVDRIKTAENLLQNYSEKPSFKGFVYLPSRGISPEVISELSRNGYSAVLEKTDSAQKSGIYENTIVLFHEKPELSAKPEDAAMKIVSEHLKDGENRLLVLEVTDYPNQNLFKLTEELRKYPFVSFVSAPPFHLKPLAAISEIKPDYGEFKTLVEPLFKNYKEAKELLQTYDVSFVVGDEELEKMKEILENSFLFAFNAPPDFDLAFKNLKKLKETIESDFEKIYVYPARVSFTSSRAQLPVSVINRSGKPVKAFVVLSARGIRFTQPKKQVVLGINENVFSFPIKIQKPGEIKIDVEIQSLNGKTISRGQIVVKSNYRTILVSAALLVFAALGFLLWLRKKIKSRLVQ